MVYNWRLFIGLKINGDGQQELDRLKVSGPSKPFQPIAPKRRSG